MARNEKITPFECGFDSLLSYRVSFYIRFYLFSLIFLVFDVEIILLFPIIVLFKNSSVIFTGILLFIYFICLLIWGLLIEYIECSLEWSV